jgi:hypothetical protein
MGTVWVEEVKVPDGLAARFFSYPMDGKITVVIEPNIASSVCST